MSKKNKTKLPIRRYLIYILIATLLMSGMTFSRYVSTSTGSGEARVAIFASDVEFSIPVDKKMAPGDEISYTILVQNFEELNGETRISEVSQRYTVTAQLVIGDIPLTLTWDDYTWDYDKNVPYVHDFHLADNPVGEGQSNPHTLTVTWPAEYNDYTYADELAVIRITVDVEQID